MNWFFQVVLEYKGINIFVILQCIFNYKKNHYICTVI